MFCHPRGLSLIRIGWLLSSRHFPPKLYGLDAASNDQDEYSEEANQDICMCEESFDGIEQHLGRFHLALRSLRFLSSGLLGCPRGYVPAW